MTFQSRSICAAGFSLLLLSGCSNRIQQPEPSGMASMALSSAAFADGQAIPDKYTCHGQDISPPLQWSGAPSGTKSIALTCEDPDAPSGTFIHWVLFDVPATATGLSENVSKTATLPDGSEQGKNSFGNTGYNGPCPPGGKTHHYVFKVYALDDAVTLSSGATREDLLNAMKDHILAQAELTGTYQD
ncbi:MAG TPA: YbhB/YbcL family Raf kinase inhibitor-like protein [Verrucomicrobiae bacterium]